MDTASEMAPEIDGWMMFCRDRMSEQNPRASTAPQSITSTQWHGNAAHYLIFPPRPRRKSVIQRKLQESSDSERKRGRKGRDGTDIVGAVDDSAVRMRMRTRMHGMATG